VFKEITVNKLTKSLEFSVNKIFRKTF